MVVGALANARALEKHTTCNEGSQRSEKNTLANARVSEKIL
jgi:hypothetical protein